ncbi:hypothetical protein JXR01_00430 [Candidatus Kaiserbacteria bacterium]|nr:MAG: hypothetical protein JXR01_00430 [Candidatus Kaiserbacteria bacterium]
MRSRAILGFASALALTLSVSTAGASLQEEIVEEPAMTPIPSQQEEIEVAAVCYVRNSYGGVWYWNHWDPTFAANQAMHLCRINTPPSGRCYHDGCR